MEEYISTCKCSSNIVTLQSICTLTHAYTHYVGSGDVILAAVLVPLAVVLVLVLLMAATLILGCRTRRERSYSVRCVYSDSMGSLSTWFVYI